MKWPIIIFVSVVAWVVLSSALLWGLFSYPFSEWRGYEIFPYLLHYASSGAQGIPFYKTIAAAILPFLLICFLVGMFSFSPREIYGDARFATFAEVGRAGLFKKNGLILGKFKGRFITSDDNTHCLLVAPTRSGKGVGVVIPNCLAWQGSLVVLDVKQENYDITAGFRAKHGHSVHLWSPMDSNGRSARFNPLDMVSEDSFTRISDLQKIASLLVSVSDRDPMWGNEARSLFLGAALYILETEDQPNTLGAVYRFLSSGQDLAKVCDHIITKQADRYSPTVLRSLGSFANKAPKEASGVANSLIASLRIFENPVVDAATSATDFDIRDLRRKRMSIYVGVLPSQLETLAPLLRLFFQQVINIMSSSAPRKDEPHKVLMLLDEFPSIGNMDAVVSAFTLLAGYNVRVLAIIQGLSWIDKNYDKDTREGLVANCAHQIFFATNDETTSQYVSDSLGERTEKQTSFMKDPLAVTSTQGTKTISVTGRPLMMPQEVRRLPRKKAVIIVEGDYPILANKIFYYKSPIFKKRLMDPPPVPRLNAALTASKQFDLGEKGEKNADSLADPSTFEVQVEALNTVFAESPDHPDSDLLAELMDVFDAEVAENPQFGYQHHNVTAPIMHKADVERA